MTLTIVTIRKAKKNLSTPTSSITKFQVFKLVDLNLKRAMVGSILTLSCELVSKLAKSFKRLNR